MMYRVGWGQAPAQLTAGIFENYRTLGLSGCQAVTTRVEVGQRLAPPHHSPWDLYEIPAEHPPELSLNIPNVVKWTLTLTPLSVCWLCGDWDWAAKYFRR